MTSLAVDTAMCGRLPNANAALTALGFATQIIFLLIVTMMGLVVGTVAVVARARGAGDQDRVNHTLLQSTMLTVLVGLVVAVVGNVIAGPAIGLLGGSGETREVALTYLRPMLAGSVFYYLSLLYAAILRGLGDARLAFLVALVSNTANVGLNYLLILGNLGFPALGVLGAAIGTVLSQALGVALMITLLRRGAVPGLMLSLKREPIDRALAARLFAVGAPAAGDMLIINAAFLSIVGMLGRVDEVAVAAHGIGLRIQALAFVPGMSVSQSTGALVGQALGSGSARTARQVVRASIALSTTIMSTLALGIVLAAGTIVAAFGVPADSHLGLFSVEWIRLLGYGMPIVGVHIAFVGMLQGAGATRTSLLINAVGTFAFQIPLSALLGFTFGLGAWGIWAAFPLSFALKAALGARAYRGGSWARVGADVRG